MSPILIDLYCERTGPGFWNEPINALSNAVFIVAAMLAWRQMAKRHYRDIWEQGVIVLAGLIGVGSFLFHTFATAWAEQADIIPIWGFVIGYTLLTIYRLTSEDKQRTLFFAVACAAIAAIIMQLTDNNTTTGSPDEPMLLNGSLQYAPALVMLLVFSCLAQWRRHAARHYLSVATLIFLLALTFRTVDLVACAATMGTGTHFIWHLLNGLMIGLLLHALVVKMPPLKRH